MSTLQTTNLKNPSSASNNVVLGSSGQTTVNGDLLFNSGYGSAATAYGCRAWVNFNGTGVVAIRASGNVSSITDNGVGAYTVNFTTSMPDANYSVVAAGIKSPNADVVCVDKSAAAPTASAVRLFCGSPHQPGVTSGSYQDDDWINVAIFR